MAPASPLIVSAAAARRLRLLHCPDSIFGTDLSEAECSASSGSSPEKRDPSRLCAGLLPAPVEVDGTAAWHVARDESNEIGVTLPTLRRLQLPSGCLVTVRVDRESSSFAERAARVLCILDEASARDGVAYLSPALAHNLGLRLHLDELLAEDGEVQAEAPGAWLATQQCVSLRRCAGLLPGKIKGEVEGAEKMAGLPSWQPATRVVPGPGTDQVTLPAATSIYLAELRCPATGSLEQFAQAQEDPKDAEGKPAPPEPEEPEDAHLAEVVVKLLQDRFNSGSRLVHAGDVIGVPVPYSAHATCQIFSAAGPGGRPGASALPSAARMAFFSATNVVADAGGSCVFVPGSTRVVLHGRVAGAQPVLVEQFAARAEGGWQSARPEGRQPEGAPEPDATRSAAPASGSPSSLLAAACASQLDLAHLFPHWRPLARLLASALHPACGALGFRLAALLLGPSGCGKQVAAAAAAAAVGCHLVSLSARTLAPADGSEKAALGALGAAFEASAQFGPTVLLLRDVEALVEKQAEGSHPFALGAALAEQVDAALKRGRQSRPPEPVILVATSSRPDDIAAPVRRCFTHELHLEAPRESERLAFLQATLQQVDRGASFAEGALADCARHTAGLLPRDLQAVAAAACQAAVQGSLPDVLEWGRRVGEGAAGDRGDGGAALSCLAPRVADGHFAASSPGCLMELGHLSGALDAVRERLAADSGAPKIPNVKWEDVGGLEDVKRAILDTVDLPLRHPELFASGLRRRSGVLLYGPPGVGKTLIAKAVATECAVNFLSVKGPELINMYVGESERQVREVFERAQRAAPCVVFFDELDSLAPARGKGSDSGGVMDRVVSQLLAEIDSCQGAGSVFLIGATNRPDLLDAALLRPGRLDKLLYVGVAAEPESKLKVLEALTRKFTLAPSVDLAAVAARCARQFTGADLYALCSDTWMRAFRRDLQLLVEEGGDSEDEERPVVVAQEDFEAAVETLQPSLSEAEILKYERIRDQYKLASR